MLTVHIKEKSFVENVHVLKDLRMEIKAGEIVAITGPSGCGKTTLLNLIAGLDKDFNGSITVNQEPGIDSHTIGVVFQTPRLMPWLTAIDNLLLVMKGDAQKNLEICEQKLEQTGLVDARDYYPHQMSGGMQRRLSMARAFVNRPSILLFDEPFSSLDVVTADKQRGLLIALCQETKPLVAFITHDLREAIAISDRILFMSTSPCKVEDEYLVNFKGERKVNDHEVNEIYSRLSKRYKI